MIRCYDTTSPKQESCQSHQTLSSGLNWSVHGSCTYLIFQMDQTAVFSLLVVLLFFVCVMTVKSCIASEPCRVSEFYMKEFQLC